MIYGYARISTAEQKLDRQTEELKNFGVSPKNIYTDKQSGSDFLRKSYIKMLKKLRQHKKHRPPRQKLSGDNRPVAYHNKKNKSRHSRAGHAAA